jgi:hypothetical protein
MSHLNLVLNYITADKMRNSATSKQARLWEEEFIWDTERRYHVLQHEDKSFRKRTELNAIYTLRHVCTLLPERVSYLSYI